MVSSFILVVDLVRRFSGYKKRLPRGIGLDCPLSGGENLIQKGDRLPSRKVNHLKILVKRRFKQLGKLERQSKHGEAAGQKIKKRGGISNVDHSPCRGKLFSR